jgi:hypothetical protein
VDENKIVFSFEGRSYTVATRAYDVDRIVLPDGRVLDVEGWSEMVPPTPRVLNEVKHVFSGDPEVIANAMNGVLAEEVINS